MLVVVVLVIVVVVVIVAVAVIVVVVPLGHKCPLMILLHCVSKTYRVLHPLFVLTFPVSRGLINQVPPLHCVLRSS
jgi:hypothetical protein